MRRVLVVQLARFGDLIQSKRLLLSLAAEKNTRTHLCVDASLAALARLLYPFAHIHSLPAHAVDKAGEAALFSATRATFAEFKACRFDQVYLLNFSPLSFAIAALFEPGQMQGYALAHGQPLRGPWISLAFNLLRDRRFTPLNLVDLWAHLHPHPLPPEKVNPIPRPAGTRRIGLVLAGRDARRSLPAPTLAPCLQAVFQARGGPAIVCIGSAGERPLVRRLARELPSRTAAAIEDKTGATSLTDLPELLLSLDMILTPDTGAMHLAAHLGVPVQAFFLSSAWCFETGPYGFGHKIWQALQPCSPCRERVPCPSKVACLAPFAHKGFLAHLAGKYDQSWPEGLLGCISALDELGVVYTRVDGEDPYQQGRREMRNGLAEYLRLTQKDKPAAVISRQVGKFLYQEKDWMLPPGWTNSPPA